MPRVYLIDESGKVVAEFPAGMTVGEARRELKKSSLAVHCNWKFRLVKESAV